MSGHTPGPWHLGGTVMPNGPDPRTNVWSAAAPGKQGGDMVAIDCRPTDALLIAAAPDLLAATKAFLGRWAMVLPAINGAFAMQHVHGGNYTGPTLVDELAALESAIAKAEGMQP